MIDGARKQKPNELAFAPVVMNVPLNLLPLENPPAAMDAFAQFNPNPVLEFADDGSLLDEKRIETLRGQVEQFVDTVSKLRQ